MALLLTIGPQLSLLSRSMTATVGSPGEVVFFVAGAAGSPKWRLVSSNLPPEWGGLVPNGDQASLSTAEAIVGGIFTVTVLVVDALRTPVTLTVSVHVFNPIPTGLNLLDSWYAPSGNNADLNLIRLWEH